MRVGEKIVLLDENKLKGIQEIIANRDIPSQERENFLKSPASFLDAYLIDLDNGFSLRVFGSEQFRQAYFGIVDSTKNTWFGENYDGQIIALSNIAPMLKDEFDDGDSDGDGDDTENKLQSFIHDAEEAFQQGRPSFDFNGSTVLLPFTQSEFESSIENIKKYIKNYGLSKTPSSDNSKDSDDNKNITVAIALNDEESFHEIQKENQQASYFYRDDINFDFLKFKPFPHQIEGIRWLLGHFFHAISQGKENFEGSLLADDMGLGKTFVTLSSIFIIHHLLRIQNATIKPILLVAPIGLLNNWVEEINKFFNENLFDSIVILHSQGELNKFRSDAKQDRLEQLALKIGPKYGTNRLDLPNRLILISYETLRQYTFSMCSIDWGMVIFDEAQKIKNPNTLASRAAKGLKADFRLAITGTPVENQLSDFWNIFDTVYPGLLGKYKDFQELYIRPINNSGGESDVRINIGKELRKKVSHFILGFVLTICIYCFLVFFRKFT